MKPRIICWFSCGAASAVAARLTLDRYRETHEVLVCYCDTSSSEHPDNVRFISDCETWFQQPIIRLRNEDYKDVDDVIEKERYMSGPKGARCTTELKKKPRLRFALPDDIHVWGYTADFRELKRIRDFEMRNPELKCMWILRDLKIKKMRCYQIVQEAFIELPTMYELGFDNNNCPGCLKASSKWYWDMTRTHFPEVFKRRCEQSRKLGVRLVEWKHHQRIFLDELPPGPYKRPRKRESLSCGPECGGSAEQKHEKGAGV